MQSKYDSYSEGGSGGQDFDDVTVKVSPFTMLQGTIVRVFGASPPWGEQSLGIAFENVVLEDGTLYIDPETGNLKTFSWKEVIGLTPFEAHEEGVPFGPDEALDRLSKTYGDTQKTYRLVGAVSEEVLDEEGDTVFEAGSKVREYEYNEADESVEFGDFEDLGGDPVPVADDVVMWYSGSTDHGPSTSAKRLAALLTSMGPDAVVSEDDVSSWFADTSGDNVLRDDLQDRAIRFFITRRESEESERSYNYPVIEDVKTGEPITYDNADDDDGDSGN